MKDAPAVRSAVALRPAQPRLHLGCGTKIVAGYVNADIVAGPGVDLVCDLSRGIPYPDSVFDEVLAVDFIEHVAQDRTIHLMNEVWRVLAPGGVFRVHVPAAPGITAFQDPTHVSYWNEESFTYYEDGHARREVYGVSYGVRARFRRRWLRRRRIHWTRFFTTFDFNYLSNHVLDLELEAVKGR
jgi:predicted SAM-dependent methyltransferase